MRIFGRDTLADFLGEHADARAWVATWLAEVERVRWASPQDIRERHATASFLPGDLVVFNVKGNRYRLATRIAYNSGVVEILWAGTHAEYSKRRW